MNRTVAFVVAFALFSGLSLPSLTIASVGDTQPVLVDALEPASTGGIPRLARLIDRAATHRRILIVGAHPDDEDTSLLAKTALGDNGESAYLSLSRGDGGQNLIGNELGVGLGLIRSQELVSAREIDGARQYFTRAYDFGYSRSIDEAFSFWPREEILRDAVRVVRSFRPHLIIAMFPPDERAGHGQHQASGAIAAEAFEAAADPKRFPEQLEEGLEPWRAQRFFRSAWFGPRDGTIEVPTGALDPLTGKSYLQIAMASRSKHRSQDMGVEQRLGPRSTALRWVEGGGAAPSDPFEGIDTSLVGIASAETESAEPGVLLEQAEAALAEARRSLDGARPNGAAPPLARALAALDQARDLAQARSTAALLEEKIDLVSEALLIASQVVVDATCDAEVVVEGGGTKVRVEIYNQSRDPLSARVGLVAAPGFSRAEGEAGQDAGAAEVSPGALGSLDFDVALALGAPPTRPYFLPDYEAPEKPALYRWPEQQRSYWSRPFEPPALVARVELSLPGLERPLEIEREVVYRYRDQAFGEVRRPVRAVPLLEVTVEPELFVWATSDARHRSIDVSLRSWSEDATEGQLVLRSPEGWPSIDAVDFALAPNGQTNVRIEIPRGDSLPSGRHRFLVEARVQVDGQERSFSASYPVIDYPHIRPTVQPREAGFEVSVGDFELPRVSAVGYFPGASDLVPETLLSIGVPLEILDARILLDAPDSVLDSLPVIVVGSRAYEIDEALVELHPRLMAWTERGGTLIVQYHKYPFLSGGFFPYPLSIARPHGRVADENAPVRVLDTGHPVFIRPNRITERDWSGWVQERGLYFASTWDDRYTPLLEMADPGRDAERGSLLVADVGEGTWVYSGLAFFRELPAGVIGAMRLFLNLLALGEEP